MKPSDHDLNARWRSGGSFSYDNNDRLSGDTSDANGNTVLSVGIANTYDFENHMLSHGAVTMVYDGDGNRVAETVGGTTTKYLVDTLNPTGYAQVVDELVNGAVTRTYAYGYSRISEEQLISSTWTPSFYGYDGHGNVRFLTGTAGTVTDTYVYDAFGLPLTTTGTTPNNLLYSGEQFDSVLGMYYLRARYYNPATGRFLSMNPEDGVISSPETLQRYIYVRNNPVNRFDPTGRADALENFAFRVWYLTQIVGPGYLVEGLAAVGGAKGAVAIGTGLGVLAVFLHETFECVGQELKIPNAQPSPIPIISAPSSPTPPDLGVPHEDPCMITPHDDWPENGVPLPERDPRDY